MKYIVYIRPNGKEGSRIKVPDGINPEEALMRLQECIQEKAIALGYHYELRGE